MSGTDPKQGAKRQDSEDPRPREDPFQSPTTLSGEPTSAQGEAQPTGSTIRVGPSPYLRVPITVHIYVLSIGYVIHY